ncbi:hypothetical protein SCHPADRAFT_900775 [Schizopora paradoxa]|uniref:Uncharacterized protein n=1 Tax=Schizopora paradoxa TaxID=27342 RepID=A0A0H2SJM4_9AGAM|nr:hypothetical protein SCHPADRAFT_900775 [Schizopora paradoxa]
MGVCDGVFGVWMLSFLLASFPSPFSPPRLCTFHQAPHHLLPTSLPRTAPHTSRQVRRRLSLRSPVRNSQGDMLRDGLEVAGVFSNIVLSSMSPCSIHISSIFEHERK